VILAMLALAAVQPLHVSGLYETVEVRAGAKVLARVVCIDSFGVDESVMRDDQRQQRAVVLQRIDSTWANADRRERARLARALDKADNAEPSALQALKECRFLLPDDSVLRAGLFYSASSGSTAFVLEDMASGQYISVLSLGERSKFPELFRALYGEAFDKHPDQATKDELEKRIHEEDQRAAAKTRAVAEVNGQRDFLPAGATGDDIGEALGRMWDNLDGEPRERIGRTLAMLVLAEESLKAATESSQFQAALLIGLEREAIWKHVPLPALPQGTQLKRLTPYIQLLLFQPPPGEVLKPFYGERGWQPPDFSLSFAQQVRRLLRGDRN